MTSRYLDFHGHRFHYRVIGQGPRVTVCFHGFGEQARSFETLSEACPGHTLVALDLPFHGETEWKEGLPFRPADLEELLSQIPETAADRIGLLGYSMGGRIAMALLEKCPERVDHLLLLAPDGLKVNPWYRLATQTVPGNRIFRFTMDRPGWFLSLIRFGARLGMVNASVEKYVERYIDDPAKRHDLYRIWTALSDFSPALDKVGAAINRHAIPVRMVFGRFDRIIPPELGLRLQRRAPATCTTTLLDCGHQIIHDRNIDALTSLFRSIEPVTPSRLT